MGYPPHSQDAVQFQQKERAALWVQVLIVILLSAALVGLSYETIGVSHDNDPWPLTFLILVPGPVFGVISMLRLRARPEAARIAGGRG